MATLTISISDENLAQLQTVAARYAVKPEDLVRISLDELLKRSDDGFRAALTKATLKNHGLYRRLAR